MAGVNPSFSLGRWLSETNKTNVADLKQLTNEHRIFCIVLPKRFIVNSFIRFALIDAVLAFISFNWFLIASIPTFAFVCLRFHIFTKQMKTFRLSQARLWICFIGFYLVLIPPMWFLRKLIPGL